MDQGGLLGIPAHLQEGQAVFRPFARAGRERLALQLLLAHDLPFAATYGFAVEYSSLLQALICTH